MALIKPTNIPKLPQGYTTNPLLKIINCIPEFGNVRAKKKDLDNLSFSEPSYPFLPVKDKCVLSFAMFAFCAILVTVV